MTSNIIIIAVIVIIFIVALRGSIKHFKGEGGCCGGGGGTVKEPDKKLSGSVIRTKVFKIDGMHCENCTNRVKRAINRIDGVSAKLNLKKKQAVVQYEKEVEDETLIKEIEGLGYKVVSVQ
ncbi:heavy-metal-associated domain-containing protein [Butyrivibrio sp. AE3004]|uniref:heavy-metal-associated domain-containing protein n=1 Tax=Butyrivibrio sp. AE3004 TaxID=1506994 RepID=UPI0004944BFD|nr:heavy metal-associated domain-containing protein [Butyrivibrio sp. AE3004]